MIVGQLNLINELERKVKNNTLPRFIIFVGPKGSQKLEMAQYITSILYHNKVIVDDISVDNIRNIINLSYKVSEPTVYIIPNVDKMSNASKNALLKVTEEPPNKARFIMTLEDINNTLPTIKSRATVYNMELFKPEELADYYCKKYIGDRVVLDNSEVLQIAETPYEIDLLVKYNIFEFIGYINKVIENIATVSGANSFKIADKINLKDDDSKYDLKLFWKGFMRICAKNLLQDIKYYAEAIKITSDALSQININGINKQMLFDKWLLNIRSVWMQ